jgi:hypothetical protein
MTAGAAVFGKVKFGANGVLREDKAGGICCRLIETVGTKCAFGIGSVADKRTKILTTIAITTNHQGIADRTAWHLEISFYESEWSGYWGNYRCRQILP